MSAKIGSSMHKVAVVNRERASGFATSVLAFVKPNIRTFSEQQWSEVWTHLGLSPAEQETAERPLANLRDRVE